MQADSHCTREISPEGSESLNAPHDWITTGPQGAVLAGFVSVVLGDVLELTTGHVQSITRRRSCATCQMSI